MYKSCNRCSIRFPPGSLGTIRVWWFLGKETYPCKNLQPLHMYSPIGRGSQLTDLTKLLNYFPVPALYHNTERRRLCSPCSTPQTRCRRCNCVWSCPGTARASCSGNSSRWSLLLKGKYLVEPFNMSLCHYHSTSTVCSAS